jgi:hypothetical protein
MDITNSFNQSLNLLTNPTVWPKYVPVFWTNLLPQPSEEKPDSIAVLPITNIITANTLTDKTQCEELLH